MSRPLIALFGVLLGLTLVLVLEGLLRLCGAGGADSDESPLSYQQIRLPLMERGRRADGTEILHTTDPRIPYQSVEIRHPEKGLRAFVFGESAVAGLGYSPNAAFARFLERMLRLAQPEHRIEVVNLGVVALASQQVKRMVEDVCVHDEPDLLIVYCGNNEFLAPHAERYARKHATLAGRLSGFVLRTNIGRILIRLLRGAQPVTALSVADRRAEQRLTEDEIIRDVMMSETEIGGVVDAYEKNLDEMAAAAARCRVPILFMSVASNWRWRGRNDLPEGWWKELVGTESAGAPAYDRVLALLDERLRDPNRSDRHESLFRRAAAHERLGQIDAARDDYRAAMNADPHLRRALDTMNERARAVARRHGALFLDTVSELAASAPGGILGFDEFYDYVHFTPRGALLTASAIFREMRRLGIAPTTATLDDAAYVRKQIEEIDRLSEDYIDVDRWLGIGFDRDLLRDRDLWKYDRMLERLDTIIARDPRNGKALAYRGNARSFQQDGAPAAESDYRSAMDTGLVEVRANLDALLQERGRDGQVLSYFDPTRASRPDLRDSQDLRFMDDRLRTCGMARIADQSCQSG